MITQAPAPLTAGGNVVRTQVLSLIAVTLLA